MHDAHSPQGINLRTAALPTAVLLIVGLLVSACEETPSSQPSIADAGLQRVEDALNEPEALARAASLAQALDPLGPDAIDQSRHIVLSHHEAAMTEQALWVSWWARHEPGKAFAWATQQRDIEISAGLMIAAMREWAAQDPQAAATTVENMSSPLKTACRRTLVRGWYASGQDGLLEYLRDLDNGRDQQGAVQAYAYAVAADEGPAALMRWADSIGDETPRFQRAALRHSAWVLGDIAPEQATAWAEEKSDSDMLEMLGAAWARHDGAASLQWASALPHDGEYETHPVRLALRHWLLTDRDGALEWISEQDLSVSQHLSPAAGPIALALARRAPERAFAWASLVPDEKKRRKAYSTLITSWGKRDREAMLAWIAEDTTLPEDMRNRVLQGGAQVEAGSEASAES